MSDLEQEFCDHTYLISQLKKGSENAFKHLYKLYYSDLCNYASNLCSDDELAEDIVQHTMINIWEKGYDLNINTTLKGYLFKSVYNRFIDTQRILNREINILDRLKKEVCLENIELSPEETEDIYRLIDIEVENLPKQCKEVFLLGKKEGLKYKEIAEKLGISIKTVERHMSIALKKLRKRLNCSSNFLYFILFNSND